MAKKLPLHRREAVRGAAKKASKVKKAARKSAASKPKAPTARPKTTKGDEWTLLAAKHPGHRHLNKLHLLTLSPEVVDAIAAAIPDFFQPDDVAFEKDLALITRLGFFDKSLIEGGGLLTPPGDPFATASEEESTGAASKEVLSPAELEYFANDPHDNANLKDRWLFAGEEPRHAGRIAPVLYEEWNDGAYLPLEILEGRPVRRPENKEPPTCREIRWATRENERRRFRQRTEGFIVWLATNAQYLSELDVLKDEHGIEIEQQRGFPRRRPVRRAARGGPIPPFGFVSEKSPASLRKFSDDLVVAFDEFYKRWSLDTLLTWDLPLPHNFDADIVWTPNDGEGLHLFLPLHLLRPGLVDLNEVIARYRQDRCPKQLRPWFDANEKRSEDHGGPFAMSRKFQLYWGWHLVLLDRYPEAVRGRLEALDQVFAPLMGDNVGEETVRKLRLTLSKDLTTARIAAEAIRDPAHKPVPPGNETTVPEETDDRTLVSAPRRPARRGRKRTPSSPA